MPNPAPRPGNQLPVETVQASAAAEPPRPYANRVCVVIVESALSDDAVRRWLGDALPIRIAPWRDREYYTAIRRLRPRLIAVLEATAELAWESGILIACLFGRFEPTVLSAVIPRDPSARPPLTVHRLGVQAEARIAALDDLTLA